MFWLGQSAWQYCRADLTPCSQSINHGTSSPHPLSGSSRPAAGPPYRPGSALCRALGGLAPWAARAAGQAAQPWAPRAALLERHQTPGQGVPLGACPCEQRCGCAAQAGIVVRLSGRSRRLKLLQVGFERRGSLSVMQAHAAQVLRTEPDQAATYGNASSDLRQAP